MCKTYVVKPRKGLTGWGARVSEEIDKMKSTMIRKSDPGIVVLADGKKFSASTMRWGFSRPFNSSINNSRSDKLESGMWSDSLRERRCLVPASIYYEWGTDSGGKKQAYEISGVDDDWLWIAGLWEENPEFGPCYSMITTESAQPLAHIHDRMPAVLTWETAQKYLVEGFADFSPHAGSLAVKACQSPLTRNKASGPEQGTLF